MSGADTGVADGEEYHIPAHPADVITHPARLRLNADLFVQERRPFVGDKLVVEVVLLSHFRYKALHLGRHIVLDEPELHWVPAQENNCCSHNTVMALT